MKLASLVALWRNVKRHVGFPQYWRRLEEPVEQRNDSLFVGQPSVASLFPLINP